MKPDKSSASSLSLIAVQIAGQVGCLLVIVVGGGIGIGLVLDQVLGTKPLFILLAVLGSVPLNIFVIYRYTIYKNKTLEASEHKEDDISGN
jgi:F0F1-type ATP synthase assembly protein I